MFHHLAHNLKKQQLIKLPTAIASLALALAGLGNVWIGAFHTLDIFALTMSITAFIIVCLVIAKYLISPTLLIHDLKDYVIGAALLPAPMTLMVVSKIWSTYHMEASYWLWIFGITLHLFLLIFFLFFRFKSFNVDDILPSWFVPPVGIAIAALTYNPMANREFIEYLLFFAMGAYFFILPLMQYRLLLGKAIKVKNRPTIAILAAPPNLCLAGYLSFMDEPKMWLIFILLGLALFMTITVYFSMFTLLKAKFTPAFAAMTFPAVIGATALGQTWRYLESIEFDPNFVSIVYLFSKYELILSTIMVCYVTYGYVKLYKNKILMDKSAKETMRE